MKINRHKKVNKALSFYVNNFGFRQPYQILIDGTFCFAALENKINISDNIPRYFAAQVKLLTTPCIIIEMEKLGHPVFGALQILKQFPIHKCNHQKKPIGASSCLLSMVNNNNSHYIVATQDRNLENEIREIPGIPLLYLHLKTPVLEGPSAASTAYIQNKLQGVGKLEQSKLSKLKLELGIVDSEEAPKKKKKIKGPNPLSCKKKKKKSVEINTPTKKEGEVQKVIKKRKKIRIPDHVKEELARKLKNN